MQQTIVTFGTLEEKMVAAEQSQVSDGLQVDKNIFNLLKPLTVTNGFFEDHRLHHGLVNAEYAKRKLWHPSMTQPASFY